MKSAPKTFQILTEAYGDETLSGAGVFKWRKRFSGGRDESVRPPRIVRIIDFSSPDFATNSRSHFQIW
ncbi:hypothetical protein TNCV_1218691 [Trichonephila clavipes]|nr:hypothetical protein TNCV_1218691 [Trichonephila clavipes]